MNASIPETMKAAAFDRFGGPEVLELKSLPVPRPKPREVLIRLDTAGIGVEGAATAHRQIEKHHLGKLAFEIRPS